MKMTMLHLYPGRTVEIDYTNWKGERSKRRIDCGNLEYGSTEWHPEPQFLLFAYDYEKEDFRQFAIKDIHSLQTID